MSKRQRIKEKEKRRKERLALGKDKLCFAIAEGKECPHGDKYGVALSSIVVPFSFLHPLLPCLYRCKFTHNVAAFLASKPPDIADKCPLFEATGTK